MGAEPGSDRAARAPTGEALEKIRGGEIEALRRAALEEPQRGELERFPPGGPSEELEQQREERERREPPLALDWQVRAQQAQVPVRQP